jgi:hypothetical protein
MIPGPASGDQHDLLHYYKNRGLDTAKRSYSAFQDDKGGVSEFFHV